jgi:cobalt-zinc-cadmium efflux system membrane fusion protein
MTEGVSTEKERRVALPRRTQLVVLGVGALVALALLFGPKLIGKLFAPKPPPPAAAPPAGTFTATPEQWATLSFARVQGTNFAAESQTDGKIATDDDQTTQVFSPFSGHVTKVLAKAGDRVRAGQPLFAIQATEFVQAQSDLVTAASALQTARAQLALAQTARQRQIELFKFGGTSQRDLQQSALDLTTAQNAVRAAEIGETAVKNRLGILGQSSSQIAALSGGAAGKATNGESVVVSPIAGTVTQRAIGVGQNIGSVTNGGAAPAFTVSDLGVVWLVGNLREEDADKAAVGQPVEVRVISLPGRVFDARVDYVSPTVDPVTRRVTVRAKIANPGDILKPEMFATFTLRTSAPVGAVGVPESAVIFEGDTAKVWVARAGRNLALRQIKVGQTSGGMVEVLSGLQPGETVVTAGSLFIDRAASGG